MATMEGAGLDMMEGHVNVPGHVCGTIHCHAGWYAIAACDLTHILSYFDGSRQMALDLGVNNPSLIEAWASTNPKIWGNRNGSAMFCEEEAFFHPTKRHNGAENLQHIIDHWTEVYERVKALELLSEPPIDALIEKAMVAQPSELTHA